MGNDEECHPGQNEVIKSKTLLEIRSVSKCFSGVKVFSDFDFDLGAGEVHCLCGENGAGKSTFIKILAGAYVPDTGDIRIDGTLVHGRLTPARAMALGIQTIYQEHTLMPEMSVMENLFIGKEIIKNGILDRAAMRQRTTAIMQSLGLTQIDPDETVRRLGTAQQKYVEIAKALVQEAKVLIMDEPTASFGAHEVESLLRVVKGLRNHGMGIIYISHHLEEIFDLADRVTVLRDGRKISVYSRGDISAELLIKDMVGRDASQFFSRETVEPGEEVMRVEALQGAGIAPISFRLRRGEILGMAGLVGAGRTEVAELLFGARPKTGGKIILNGKEVSFRRPGDAIRAGLCMITEDRQLTGLFLNQPIDFNTALVEHAKSMRLFMPPEEDRKIGEDFIRKFRTKCRDSLQRVRFLSGGNQQKVILSKWFHADGDVFIFDEPTRGVDIGAREEIYQHMVELCRAGKALIMISSDLPEVIALSNRVLVMRQGHLVKELGGENEIKAEKILSVALGESTL